MRPTRRAAAARIDHRDAILDLFRGYVDRGMRRLTPAERAVYEIVLRETRPDGTARVARAVVAERADVSERAVTRALASLLARGALLRLKPGAGDRPPIYSPFNARTLRESYPKAARWLPPDARPDPADEADDEADDEGDAGADDDEADDEGDAGADDDDEADENHDEGDATGGAG